MSKFKNKSKTIERALSLKFYQMFRLLGERRSVDAIEEQVGVSNRAVHGIVRSANLMLQANDDTIEEFIELIQNWGEARADTFLLGIPILEESSQYLMDQPALEHLSELGESSPSRDLKMAALEHFAREWSVADMRGVGTALLKLADAFDPSLSYLGHQSSFRWPSAAAKIERNAIELAKKATLLRRQTDMRETFIPADLLGEPAWNMLLELFCQFAGGAKMTSKSLCISAACPETTALRFVERLEDAGLVHRSRSPNDRRVTLVELSQAGVIAVGRVLERL